MKNNLLKLLTTVFIFIICAISLARISIPSDQVKNNVSKEDNKSKLVSTKPYKDPKDLRKPYNWRKSSQIKPYPRIKRLENDLTVRVSLKGNRVYILREDQVVYTMLASGGIFKKGKSLTPTGTFKITSNRGDSFYNPELNEGAKNWLSWSKQSDFLFHSVPTKSNGKYNKKEAKKLGVKPSSHGCIRLSVPDSRWLMKHIPSGTKVIIKNN